MVRKIIVNADASHLAAKLQSPPHTLKVSERHSRLRRLDAKAVCRRDGGKAILGIVQTDQRPAHDRGHALAMQNLECGPVRLEQAELPVRACDARACETDARRPAAHGQHPGECGIRSVPGHPAGTRHRAHQVMELALDGSQVRIDVGMVKLEICQHQVARVVVHELGALVEKGGVVLIRLDDESWPFAGTRGESEVGGHATDQKSRRAPRPVKNPREHAGGRRLAVGAGDSHDFASAQQILGEPLRARGERESAVQQALNQRVAATHDVSDQHDVRRDIELAGVVAVDQRDAKRLELAAHRRIDVRVRARHPMARRACERGDAAHEGAADADHVDVHQAVSGNNRVSNAALAIRYVTEIAMLVTKPTSRALFRMWPTTSVYHTITPIEPAQASRATG